MWTSAIHLKDKLHDFSWRKEVFDILDDQLEDGDPVVVALSWWPDSMLVSACVIYYFFTNSLDKSRLYFCHYDHRQREESVEQLRWLAYYFRDFCFYSDSYSWKKSTESELRKARRKFIFKICRSFAGSSYVVTWHNLSDRVETSFLHLQRGCMLNWLVNMQRTQKVVDHDVTILRPLLRVDKWTIQSLCEQFTIPFFVDPSNTIRSISQRNRWRHDYLPQHITYSFLSPKTYRDQRNRYYGQLEQCLQKVTPPDLQSMQPSPLWGVSDYYCCDLPQTRQELTMLFWQLSALRNSTFARIAEIFERIHKSDGGHRYINGWYLFLSHWKLYLLFSWDDNKFWTKRHDLELAVKTKWPYHFVGFDRSVSDEYNWTVMRLAKKWDRYQWKSLKKRFINKKVPHFRRNTVPILVKNTTIVATLPLRTCRWIYW